MIEVMEKLNAMESEHKKDRTEIKELTSEVQSLRKEKSSLREEVSSLKQKTSTLEEENTSLKAENRLLHDDNERMKRILANDSNNSSTPPSNDQPEKAPNSFNGRKTTEKKPGASWATKGAVCQRLMWNGKFVKGSTDTGSSRLEILIGPASPDTGLIWK